ncbi:MAG: hypothetical protein AB7T27_11500 [Kiritimatiellia bacterium]
MQPCFGITQERLLKYYEDMRSLGLEPVETDAATKATLFLSGINYGYSYIKASFGGSENETYFGPAHWPEDGLNETAKIVLKRLMKIAKKRMFTSALKTICPDRDFLNEECLRLTLAWCSLNELESGTVWKWLERVGPSEGWLRLCIATGIISISEPSSLDYIYKMMSKPLYIQIPGFADDQNRKVLELLKTFVRDHNVDLREI